MIDYDFEPMMSDVLRKNQYSPTAAGIIGGLVGLLLFFIPFSPLLGGGISSFLMRSPDNSALVERSILKAGSIAGGGGTDSYLSILHLFDYFCCGKRGFSHIN